MQSPFYSFNIFFTIKIGSDNEIIPTVVLFNSLLGYTVLNRCFAIHLAKYLNSVLAHLPLRILLYSASAKHT